MTTLAQRVGERGRVIGGPFGSKLTQADYSETGVPVIRGQNMQRFGRWIGGEFAYVSTEKFDRDLRSNAARPGDIIVTQRGTLGQVSIVPIDYPHTALVVSQSQMAITVDPEVADPLYVYYWLRSKAFSDYLFNATIQVGVPHINLGILREAPADWPDLAVQRSVSKILGSLDDKIELNRRMNETLEAMAQALFRDWFVDFGPTRRKLSGTTDPIEIMGGLACDPTRAAELAANFPDALGGNGLPAGWEERKVEEIAARIAMGPFGSNIKVETFTDAGIPIISGKHLNETLLCDDGYNFISLDHADRLSGANVGRDDIIFTHAGNIGQVSLVPHSSRYERYVLSQRQFYVRCDPRKASARFLIYFFRSEHGQHKLLANASSTGVPSIARPASNLKAMTFMLPSFPAMQAFDKVIETLHELIGQNRNNIETLAATRDLLLPKLMSNEIHLRYPEPGAGGA